MKGISLVFVLLLAAFASAADSFDVFCANIQLLQEKQVQADVGITADQRARMNKFADAHRAKLEAYGRQLAGKVPDNKVLAGYMNELKKNVLSVMSAAQIKRLRELNLQAAGLIGLTEKVVATKVGMTDAQYNAFRQTYISGKASAESLVRKEILPIDQKYQKLSAKYKGKEKQNEAELKKLTQQYMAEVEAIRNKLQPRIEQVTKSTQQKMISLITPQQKATWIALQGKKFILKK